MGCGHCWCGVVQFLLHYLMPFGLRHSIRFWRICSNMFHKLHCFSEVVNPLKIAVTTSIRLRKHRCNLSTPMTGMVSLPWQQVVRGWSQNAHVTSYRFVPFEVGWSEYSLPQSWIVSPMHNLSVSNWAQRIDVHINLLQLRWILCIIRVYI